MWSILSVLLGIVTFTYVFMAALFLIGLFRPRSPKNETQYAASVIVAARDEEETITACLSALIAQTYPSDRYEIVVVDDGSMDATAQIVRELCDRCPNLRLLHAPPAPEGISPKKHALSVGIRNSDGEIILTIDADCRVKPTWVETMIGYFEPDVGMVIGFSQMGTRGEALTGFEKWQAFDFLTLMSAAAGTANVGFPLAASGQNLAYRRRAFEKVHGFERIAHRISGDDVLLVQLIRRTSWKIAFAGSEDAFNTTRPVPALRGLFEQRKRWASNGPYQHKLNLPFFLYMFSVFLLALLLLITVPYTVLVGGYNLPWICLGAKALADFCVTARGAQLFGRLDLLRYFPLWAILHIPYVVFAGLFGTFAGFTWKERRHAVGRKA